MDEQKRAAVAAVEEKTALICRVADAIWDYAELSLQEEKSAALYCSVLEEEGFTVERGVCSIPTAFAASYGAGRPHIALLAEYDALSGLSQEAGALERRERTAGGSGHGCGHNLLGVGSLAAAMAVKRYLEETGAPGTVIFFGCPGEEGGSGKAFLAREGQWRKLDAALSWHPSDVNQIKTGTNNSSIQVLYKFKGVAAHAAGEPYNGRSALDAVELMNVGVQFLREHVTDDCRIHYAITDTGGISPNVVQARASVLYMVRANKVADSVKLQARVDDIARGAALMTGTSFERVFIDGTAELLPNFTLEKLLYENFQATKLPVYTQEERDYAAALRATYPLPMTPPGTGARFDETIAKEARRLSDNMQKPINDFLLPLYSGTGFLPGSTDVGDVSWQTPTSQIEVATWPADVPGHSWQVVACGKSSMAHKGMLTAGKVLAGAAIDLLEKPTLLAAARAEFEERSASGYVCPIEPDAVPIAL